MITILIFFLLLIILRSFALVCAKIRVYFSIRTYFLKKKKFTKPLFKKALTSDYLFYTTFHYNIISL